MFLDYFILAGTLNRRTFVVRLLPVLVCLAVVAYAFYSKIVIASWIGFVVVAYALFSLVIRRCRDIGCSDWVLLLVLICLALPGINLVLLLWLALAKGKA